MGDNVDRVLEQWLAERPDLDASPMGVIGRVQRASRRLERGLSENFALHGLQLWEFDILGTLRRSGPPYRLTAGALSASAMVTSGAITNRIDRLVAKGLVTRETDPANRRSVAITLTESGWQVIEDVLAHHVAEEERLLAALSADERRQLAALLRTLLVGLGDVPSAPVPETAQESR
ncbi:MarR family winged helix-turn-helix transcriptional regulator [Actinomadura hibisca]|uniref:MarR family winged helix-turn-helix transcriptional regulator n=1 Tax=Actinomadura hibisca TaxID=68565 RepID=UPI0008333864|nr:MarR family transcriptional regulator [Actinomadura hibisca]